MCGWHDKKLSLSLSLDVVAAKLSGKACEGFPQPTPTAKFAAKTNTEINQKFGKDTDSSRARSQGG